MPDKLTTHFNIKDHWKSNILIVLMTLYSIVVLYTAYSYAILPLLVLTAIAISHIKLQGKNEYIKDLYLFPLIFIEIAYFFQLISLIDIAESSQVIYLVILLHNNAVFLLIPTVLGVYLLVRAIGGHRAAAIAVPIPFALLAATDFYVTRFRGHEIMFSDFRSFETGMNVAGNYSYDPIIPLALIAVPYALVIICAFNIAPCKHARPVYARIIFGAASMLSFVLAFSLINSYFKYNKFEQWDYNGAYYNTFYINFEGSILKSIAVKPDGYSTEAIDAYAEDIAASAPEEMPNIIVIMNESYMDISVYSAVTGDIENPDPYWDSLSENTIRGYALSSVFGGNTANSEFEFLTGLSMANLPSGSVAYNQYIDDPVPSLPRLLDGLGYTSTAMHPFLSNGWKRTTVYPLMHFDDMVFEEGFSIGDGDLIRGYASDMCAYRYLLTRCDESASEPSFYFLITVQNHGGFGDDNNGPDFTPAVYVDDPSMSEVNNYLTLIHESDNALQYLIEELSSRDERYVVLIFGDHQPDIDLTVSNSDNASYIPWMVPYIIWTNYDMDPSLMTELDHTTDFTSINYLSLDVLTVAGITPDPYYDLLYQIRDGVPCINAAGYRLAGDDIYHPLEDEADSPMMDLYAYITYDVLFDSNDSAATAVTE